jgi:hypothetical protein
MELDELRVTGDSQRDWHRAIVSLRVSVDLFRELVDDPADQSDLIAHEMATKPCQGEAPLITRPFEESEIYDPIAEAIGWPFEHPCRSRFSAGDFGVWYGSDSLLTSVHETVYHFRLDTLASSAVAHGSVVVQERRVHLVACTAALIDLRPHLAREPRLIDPHDYSTCQALGARIYHAALPGVLSQAARYAGGHIVGVFRRDTLTDPRMLCYLTYHLDVDTGRVRVERDPGQTLVDITA